MCLTCISTSRKAAEISTLVPGPAASAEIAAALAAASGVTRPAVVSGATLAAAADIVDATAGTDLKEVILATDLLAQTEATVTVAAIVRRFRSQAETVTAAAQGRKARAHFPAALNEAILPRAKPLEHTAVGRNPMAEVRE